MRTVRYPGEFANDFHITLDSEVLVTVRVNQVEGLERRRAVVVNRYLYDPNWSRQWDSSSCRWASQL